MTESTALFSYDPFWFVLLTIFSLILCILTVLLVVRMRSVAAALAERSLADLLSSRELFYTLYRNSPVPYVLLLKGGEMSLVNDAAVRLFGLSTEEFHGKILFDFLSAEDTQGAHQVELLPAKFKQGAPVNNLECRLVRLDGQIRWVILSMFPVVDRGNPHRGLAALVDITKQKEVDRAKTEFVSLASHQLRTPLASLRWNIDLLASPKSGELSKTQQGYLTTIARGVSRMNVLIDDFLSMSRLELGMLPVEPTRIVVQDFMADIVREIKEPAAQKQLDLAIDIDTPVIVADTRLLHHIVANLLSNAIKYTPVSGKVRIRAYEHDRTAIIEVSDNGVGIPEAEQGKLFEKFFRASNAKTASAEGTGLGLYIVKLAAEALGGTISFASREGLGTAFTIRLPQ